MWRWTALLCIAVLHEYGSSQPVTEDSKNDRTPRQLDFGECCPCDKYDVQAFDGDSQDTLAAGTEDMLPRARVVDDCPCRLRSDDAQGSASVFFPTAMRAAGALLRPDDKKEDLKPIFNPEVGLASSVLETLREVTDEEYREALARDAAKSAVREVEDIEFGDAIPQESGNLFTIVVNPNADADYDSMEPQASHVHTSRCIHPISSARSLARMRTPKPSLVIHKPKLPKLRPKLLHRHYYDMDSGVGASNVHEHIVPIDGEVKDLRANSSPLKTNADMKIASSNTNEENCNKAKIPDFHSDAVQNKLKEFELRRSSLLQNLRDKSSYLSRVPKLGLDNLLPGKVRDIDEDLSPASSTVNEVAKKVPYFKTNSPLGSVLQSGRPLSLSNILNLRDVELVPLKDMTPIKEKFKLKKPKLELPSLFKRTDTDRSIKKDIEEPNISESRRLIINKNAVGDDTEGSPSVVNIQVIVPKKQIPDDDCDDGIAKSDNINTKTPSTEILDKLPDSKNKQPNIVVTNEDVDCLINGDNQDLITDSNNNINQVVEPAAVQRPLKSINDTIEEQRNVESNQEIDCLNQSDEDDLIINSNKNSNQVNKPQEVIEPQEVIKPHEVIQPHKFNEDISTESKDSGDSSDKSPENEDSTTALNSLVSIDKTLSTIKENIAKKIEDLKHKTNARHKHILNRITNNNNIESDAAANRHNNQEEDSLNEPSNQVTINETTISPDILNDVITTTLEPQISAESSENDATTSNPEEFSENAKEVSECFDKAVSMDDLQNISNSMLEQEEQLRKSKKSQCTESSHEEVQVLSENGKKVLDADQSATTVEIVIEPESSHSIERQNIEENTCESDLSISKPILPSQTDVSAEASNVIINSVRPSNDVISSQPIIQPIQGSLDILKKPLPKISDVLKLPQIDNLPSLDGQKFKLTNLFVSNTDNAQERSNLDIEPTTNTQQTINPVMETDASTTNFKLSKAPFLQDANFDIFGFKRPSSLLESIPKLELPLKKSMFPLDLSPKPLKLKSALDDKGGFLSFDHPNIAAIFKSPKLDFTRENSRDSALETKNIHSSIKKSQKALDSKLRQATRNYNIFKTPLKSSPSLLEAISRNHEDISDKLRAIHMDFNDRIETMHNELTDRTKLLTGESFNDKPSTKLSSTLRKESKSKPLKQNWQASSRKESPKPLKTRKPVQQKLGKTPPRSKVSEQKLFKMPAAASVPVPKTVQVPELRPASVKSSPFTLQRSYFNVDATPTKETFRPLQRQAGTLQSTNKLFEKPFNLKKGNKITVSFSTTPRPVMVSATGKSKGKFRNPLIYEDHKVAPSEMTQIKIAAPTSDQLFKESRIDKGLQARKSLDSAADNLKQLEKEVHPKDISFRSWPSASESDFLSKVREAVKTRLSKMNMPLALRQPSHKVENIEEKPSDVLIDNLDLDMAREASENKEIIEVPTLKENVSYKCTMVCTKE